MARYLLPLFPGQVRLCAVGRQIQLLTPNYLRVYPEAEGYINRDASVNVFTIEATPDQVNVVQQGQGVEHLLWKGNKNARDNNADLVAVAVEALIAAPVADGKVAELQVQVTNLTAQLGATEDKLKVATAAQADLQAKLAANFEAAEKAIAAAQGATTSTGA